MVIHPKLFILDEPTRGVDVGAKSEIYRMMIEMAKKGVAIWYPGRIAEIVGMSDRVYGWCGKDILWARSAHNKLIKRKYYEFSFWDASVSVGVKEKSRWQMHQQT